MAVLKKLPIAILLVLLSVPCALPAQGRSPSGVVSLSAFAGFAWSGSRTGIFEETMWDWKSTPMRAGPSFGIGMQFDPSMSVLGTAFLFSVEAGFAQETGTNVSLDRKQEITIRRFPIVVWIKLIANARLSPFARIGFGGARTSLREAYSGQHYSGVNLSFCQWRFVWGLGGGLNYQVSSTVQIEGFVETSVSEASIQDDNDQWRQGLKRGFGLSIVGFRALYSL